MLAQRRGLRIHEVPVDWTMEISGRIFGFSTWSMLVPQALEGVACVAVLYAAVKRWFGAGAECTIDLPRKAPAHISGWSRGGV